MIRTRVSALFVAGLASSALLLGACGSDTLSSSGGGNSSEPRESVASTVTVTADPALQAALPQKIKDAGKIVVGTDPSYAPNEFFGEDGKTPIGMDIDLFNAVAQQFGVEVEWQASGFDQIILGVDSGKYDVGISSFSVTEERKQQVTMVSYFTAGSLWVTQTGNPKKVDPDDACGKTVAVQTGTIQLDDLNARSKKCTADGKPAINLLPSQKQTDVTTAVVSGKADAMAADSPVALYAIQQNQDALEELGQTYDSAPYGYVLPKDETAFAQALATALEKTKANGEYTRVLNNWNQSTGALVEFQVNP